MASLVQIPLHHDAPVLHLYRHLLREASYLPPPCRPYITTRIQKRFRSKQHEGTLAPKRIKQGHRSLRILRAANAGDVERMTRVALLVFGRAGPERHRLLQSIIEAEPPRTSEEFDKSIAKSLPSPEPDAPSDGSEQTQKHALRYLPPVERDVWRRKTFLDTWNMDKLLQYVRSQRKHHDLTASNPVWPQALRSSNPKQKVPKEDIWGNPFPKRLEKKRIWKWWLDTLPRLMPPVGTSEWETLRDLATGSTDSPMFTIPERRAVAQSLHPENPAITLNWPWKEHALRPVHSAEKRNSFSHQLLFGTSNEGPYGRRVMPRSSKRTMQRIYGRIWAITPHIAQDPYTLQSKIQWGSVPLRTPEDNPSTLGELFAGVTDMGMPLGSTMPAPQRKSREKRRKPL